MTQAIITLLKELLSHVRIRISLKKAQQHQTVELLNRYVNSMDYIRMFFLSFLSQCRIIKWHHNQRNKSACHRSLHFGPSKLRLIVHLNTYSILFCAYKWLCHTRCVTTLILYYIYIIHVHYIYSQSHESSRQMNNVFCYRSRSYFRLFRQKYRFNSLTGHAILNTFTNMR